MLSESMIRIVLDQISYKWGLIPCLLIANAPKIGMRDTICDTLPISKVAPTLFRFQKAPFSKSSAFNRISVDGKEKCT